MTSSQSDFITWLQNLDLTDLSNEAEVESKFVIPLFQKLGFPDSVRRDKHPLITYRPGRRGRKPEIDLIYFSVSEPSEQTASTSLVIVEAKEPGKSVSAEDIAQAKFYSYYLKAPFLVITNGRQLKVLQQYSYHEEMVFDSLVDMLKDEVVAGKLFDRLHYETVKAIKHSSPLLPATFVFENYLPPAPKHFCGRVEELSMLQNAVQSNTITIVGGIAGIGKTYLTAELTQSLSCSPLWLSFEPKTHVDQFVTTIAGYVEEIFDDKKSSSTLRAAHLDENQRSRLVAAVLNKYECFVVWDGFDQRLHQSFNVLLNELSRHLDAGRLVITTQHWKTPHEFFNPPFRLPALTPFTEEEGIRLLRRLGVGEDVSVDSCRRAVSLVGGHPKFLTILAGLSQLYPMEDLLSELPHVSGEVHEYLKRRMFDSLDGPAQRLLLKLSLMRIPFTITAARFLSETDSYEPFDILVNRFLVTRCRERSDRYEIHELLRGFCEGMTSKANIPLFEKQIFLYYAKLPSKLFIECRMAVEHALRAGLLDEAKETLRNLLLMALRQRMYRFVLDYTQDLHADERVQTWGFIYHFRGRVFRFKEQYDDAKKDYEKAIAFALNTEDAEVATFELASILVFLADSGEGDYDRPRQLFSDLLRSENPEVKLQATNSLGTLSIRQGDDSCIAELEQALSLAEEINSWVNIFQLCIVLGQAYSALRKDSKRAIFYLERALKIQLERQHQLGGLNPEARYITNVELAKLYAEEGRLVDAIKCRERCVEIDQELEIVDRLAESLHYLGRQQSTAGDHDAATESFRKSKDLIEQHQLHGHVEIICLEWEAASLWDQGHFEASLEQMMEAVVICEREGLPPNPLPIMRQQDGPPAEVVKKLRAQNIILLILPEQFDFQIVTQAVESIVRRRPDLARG